MLRRFPVSHVAAGLSGAALPADAIPAAELRTSRPLRRLAVGSADFALRLFLYWGMTCVLRKMRTQGNFEDRNSFSMRSVPRG
jgi:hypothetical protein